MFIAQRLLAQLLWLIHKQKLIVLGRIGQLEVDCMCGDFKSGDSVTAPVSDTVRFKLEIFEHKGSRHRCISVEERNGDPYYLCISL